MTPEPPCGRHKCRVMGVCLGRFAGGVCSFENGEPVVSHMRAAWSADRDGVDGWDRDPGVRPATSVKRAHGGTLLPPGGWRAEGRRLGKGRWFPGEDEGRTR